jgi:hypothetical protein
MGNNGIVDGIGRRIVKGLLRVFQVIGTYGKFCSPLFYPMAGARLTGFRYF